MNYEFSEDARIRYAVFVMAKAQASSGSTSRAEIAAREAAAQASGSCGPEGVAMFERWLRDTTASTIGRIARAISEAARVNGIDGEVVAGRLPYSSPANSESVDMDFLRAAARQAADRCRDQATNDDWLRKAKLFDACSDVASWLMAASKASAATSAAALAWEAERVSRDVF